MPSRVLVELAAATAATVGPAVYLRAEATAWWPVAMAIVATSITAGTVAGTSRSARHAVALAAGLVVGATSDPFVGTWAAGGLVLADWAVRANPPHLRLARPGEGALPAFLVLSAVAAWQGTTGHAELAVGLVGVAALVAILLSTVGGGLLGRVGARAGEVAATAVSALTFASLGLLAVVLPWIGQRTARHDPLGPAGGGTAWLPRDRGEVQARSPWSPDDEGPPAPRWHRARSLGATLVTTGAAAAILWTAVTALDVRSSPPPPLEIGGGAAAQADSPWYDDHLDDVAWITDERGAWRPLRARRVLDVSTRTITVEQGLRRTWQPPTCDCPEATIWLYGGSTVFGIGQRDEHTIASELAKVAWEDGVALTVDNRGVIGHGHWWEARRFSWDLSLEEAPDLAVFYDGYEEVRSVELLDDPELEAPGQAIDRVYEEYWREVRGRADDDAPEPPGARFEDYPDPPRRSDEDLGLLAAARYEQVVGMSRATAEGFGVPVARVWQPTRWSRASEADLTPREFEAEESMRVRYAAATGTLPAETIDLSGVLDAAEGPLFTDAVHHNEVAARTVAEALYRVLEPQIRQLVEEGGPPS